MKYNRLTVKYDILKHKRSFRCNVHHSAQYCYRSPTQAPGNWDLH